MSSRLVDWICPTNNCADIHDNCAQAAPDTVPDNRKKVSTVSAVLTSPNHEHSPVRRKPSNRTVVYIPELHQIKDDAKTDEFKRSLQAIIDAFTTQAATPAKLTELLNEPTQPPHYYLKLRIYYILDSLRAQGTQSDEFFNTDAMKQATEELCAELTCNVSKLTLASVEAALEPHFISAGLESNVALLHHHAKDLFKEITTCFCKADSFEKQYTALRAKVMQVAKLITGSIAHLHSDPKSRTQAILQELRQALEMPAYLLMRCEEQNPCVRLLHAIVIGSFAHSETVPSYLKLGKAISEKADIKRVDSLGDILTATREAAANAGFHEDDPLVNDYTISRIAQHFLPETVAISVSKITDIATIGFTFMRAGISPLQTIQAIVSYTQAYFCSPSKDYRGIYDNLPSALYEETFKNTRGATATLRVVIGPSSAQGDTVLPEFYALLQALQNRRMNPTENMPYPYSFFTYANLQNRFGGHEGLQTNALMHLNALYPFSFDAFTLSADPLADCETFDESIMQKMLNVLFSEQSYTLDALDEERSNYYFNPRHKEGLREIFTTIVSKAYNLVLSQTQIEPSKRVGIFCDLVHLGIIRYKETKTVSSFMQSNEAVRLLTSRICAVCVDRGMMINTELLYVLDRRARVCAEIDIGRGILSKKRLPLEKRVKQIGILAHDRNISSRIHQYLDEIGDLASTNNPISSAGISYPGCTDDMIPPDRTPTTKRKLFLDNSSEDLSPPAQRRRLNRTI